MHTNSTSLSEATKFEIEFWLVVILFLYSRAPRTRLSLPKDFSRQTKHGRTTTTNGLASALKAYFCLGCFLFGCYCIFFFASLAYACFVIIIIACWLLISICFHCDSHKQAMHDKAFMHSTPSIKQPANFIVYLLICVARHHVQTAKLEQYIDT